MPRLFAIDIPDKKRVEVSLTYIYGIGLSSARKILSSLKIENKLAKDLTPSEINQIQDFVRKNEILIEGNKKREEQEAIKRLIRIGCYRGRRHYLGLSVRGQRTRNKGGEQRRNKRRKRANY